jgi:D-inositol-3-phosphate glycosyltransferase
MWRVSPAEATSAPTVFGSRVFKQAIFREVIRHSRMDRSVVLASPFDQPALKRSMEDLVASGSSVRSVRVLSTTSLLADASWLSELTAWHEVDERCQFAAELRWARARRAFPITTTNHAFGYREQLSDLYTRMLLLDIRPYDAHICMSQAARVAFRKVLDGVTEQLNAAHRTKLRYRGRLEVIPAGVDTDYFRPGDKSALRAGLGLPRDAIVLLWFGRLSFVDKADLLPLLTVYRDLVRRNPRRRLLLVLAGSSINGSATILERYCEDLGVAERVRILSPLGGLDRRALLAAADVFVSPGDSVQEAFGQTPVEAMACGVPQVVSDWDGYRDTVVDGETGFLVPTYFARCDRDVAKTPLLDWDLLDHSLLAQSLVVDVRKLRAALQALIDDRELRARFGHASRQRAIERFGWGTVVRQYDSLWLELAAEAAKTKWRPDPRHANLVSPFFDAFRAYPTAILNDATRVRITEEGRRALTGKAPIPAYFVSAAQTLDLEVLVEALRHLQRRGATLGTVARAIARPGWHRDHARRHVLWHVKQGFAEALPAHARRSARYLRATTSRGS